MCVDRIPFKVNRYSVKKFFLIMNVSPRIQICVCLWLYTFAFAVHASKNITQDVGIHDFAQVDKAHLLIWGNKINYERCATPTT